MICPVDKSDMIVVEHGRIELDYCTRCRGVWFDSGELELLLESAGVGSHTTWLSNILSSPEANSAEKRWRCPICKREMKKTTVGQPGMLIDVCRKGDGLWFDGGEVGQLLKHLESPGKAGPDHVTDFLKEAFKAGG